MAMFKPGTRKPHTPERIRVGDKVFKIFLTAEEIHSAVVRLGEQISKDLKDEPDPVIFVAVLNGAMIFASDLVREITIPLEYTSTRLKSYVGDQSSGTVKTIRPLEESVVGRTVVIVEDIVDSGRTIDRVVKQLHDLGAKTVKTAVLLFKSSACLLENPPVDYYAFDIPPAFVVGYGLDYNELGREYASIYSLDES